MNQFISVTMRLLEQGFTLSDIEEEAKQAMIIASIEYIKRQETELGKALFWGSKQ